MFGHKSQPSVMWRYGALKPTSRLDLVREQMWLAHRYRNDLVALELNRRKAVDAALREVSPELSACEMEIASHEEALEKARTSLKAEQAKARSKVRPEALVAPIRSETEALKALRARRKALRAAMFASEPWKLRQEAIEAEAAVALKAKRASCGLFWSTYLLVEQSMAGSRSGAPPRFMKWRGDGHLAIQFQGGVDPAALFAETDARMKVRVLPCRHKPDSRRSQTQSVVISWRVQSDEKGKPIWAEIPAILHRPIPSDSRIKWAHLIRQRVGTHDRWEVEFSISRESGWAKPDLSESGTIALDVGWRMREDGSLRVCYWQGSDGREGELCLPRDWLGEMRRTESIRSHRDTNFNDAHAKLVSWLGSSPPMPDLMKEKVKTLPQWKSAARLAALTIEWREKRFDGDAEAFHALEEWRKRDRHLYEFEAQLRDQLYARRQNIYRKFASEMRRTYKTAIIEALDLRDFHVLGEAEDPAENGALREHTRDACLSLLIRCIKESVREVVKENPKDTTRKCPSCRHVNAQRDPTPLELTCDKCTLKEDQDRTATTNLLAARTASNDVP